VSGYCWTQIPLKQEGKVNQFLKSFSESSSEMDVEIKDTFGSAVQIGVRIQFKKAFYYVTFFAHTCIINHSLFKLKFHYDQINKQLLGG